jgi:hypothetical protein
MSTTTPIKILVTADTAEAAAAMQAFINTTHGGLQSLVPAAAAGGAELRKLRESALGLRESFHALEAGVYMLGGQRFPELAEGVMAARSAMMLVRTTAMLTGASLTAVALPLIALAAVLAPTVYEYVEMDKAQKLAAESQKRLIDQTAELLGLMKKLTAEASKAGALDEQETNIINGLLARGKLAEAQGLMQRLGATRPAISGLEDYKKLSDQMDRESGNEFDNARVKAHEEYLEKIKRLDADYKSGALEIPYKQANAEAGFNGPEVDPKIEAAAEYQRRQAQAQTILDNALSQADTKQAAEQQRKLAEAARKQAEEVAKAEADKRKLVEAQDKEMDTALEQYANATTTKTKDYWDQVYSAKYSNAKDELDREWISQDEFDKKVAAATKEHLVGYREVNKELENQMQLEQEIARTEAEVKLKRIEDNPFLTNAQKQQQSIPITAGLMEANNKDITAQKGIASNPATSDAARAEALKRVNELTLQQISLQKQLDAAQHANDYGWQIKSQIAALGQFMPMAQRAGQIIANTLTNAVQGLANALTSVIMGTKSAGQAFAQFAEQMLTSFISMVIEAILWAKLAIPILTALGVLSGGATAAAGAPATIAAVTVGISGVGAAMAATGGLITGPGTGTSDSIPAFLSNGEYVFPASAVDRIGVENLAALHHNGTSTGSAVAGSSGGSSSALPPKVVTVFDRQSLMAELKKPDYAHITVQHVLNNKTKIGIPT